MVSYPIFLKVNICFRQGDPWFPYLFILCVEPLVPAIKNSRCINDIDLKNIIYKIGQYADDNFISLDGTEQSLRNLNIDKTNVVWLESEVKCNDNLPPDLSLKRVNNFKVQGIYLTSDLMRMLRRNKTQHLMKVIKGIWEETLVTYGKSSCYKTTYSSYVCSCIDCFASPRKPILDNFQ